MSWIKDLVLKHQVPGISNKDLWDKMSDAYADVFVDPPNTQLLDFLIENTEEDSDIFEYGCSSGMNLAYLIRHGRPNVSGVDISQVAIDKGQVTYADLDLDIKVGDYSQEGSLQETQCEAYDLVFTRGTLQHLNAGEVRQTISILLRQLRPGGLLAIDEAMNFVDPIYQQHVKINHYVENIFAHPWGHLMTEVYSDLVDTSTLVYPQQYTAGSGKLTPLMIRKK